MIRHPQNKAEWAGVVRLLQAYRNEFNDDTCFTSFEQELTDIEQIYAKGTHVKLVCVAVPEDILAGCVALKVFSPGVVEMKRLYVTPSHRGHHVGLMLAEAIIAVAIERGYQKMVLDTMIEMKAAQQLYRHLGFEVIPPYNHQDPEKVICFEKMLLPNRL
jgi:ribosomal protein S18 acetylase RimI-like enzyme